MSMGFSEYQSQVLGLFRQKILDSVNLSDYNMIQETADKFIKHVETFGKIFFEPLYLAHEIELGNRTPDVERKICVDQLEDLSDLIKKLESNTPQIFDVIGVAHFLHLIVIDYVKLSTLTEIDLSTKDEVKEKLKRISKLVDSLQTEIVVEKHGDFKNLVDETNNSFLSDRSGLLWGPEEPLQLAIRILTKLKDNSETYFSGPTEVFDLGGLSSSVVLQTRRTGKSAHYGRLMLQFKATMRNCFEGTHFNNIIAELLSIFEMDSSYDTRGVKEFFHRNRKSNT